MSNRRGGILHVTSNGRSWDVKGSWTITPAGHEREGIEGANTVPGFKAKPRIPTIEGVIVDPGTANLEELYGIVDGTIVLGMGNGRTAVLRNAWFAGAGSVTTEEGEVAAKFQGKSMDMLAAR